MNEILFMTMLNDLLYKNEQGSGNPLSIIINSEVVFINDYPTIEIETISGNFRLQVTRFEKS